MKTLITITLILVAGALHAQTVRRVNNLPAINAPYTTIAAAIAAASPGDIIQVEGSQFNYSLSQTTPITKKVSIIGPGYFLDQNTGLQANTYPATLDGFVIFDVGSEGSSIRGMSVVTQLSVKTSNIEISFNNLAYVSIDNVIPCSNFIVHSNFFGIYAAGNGVLYGPGAAPENVYSNMLISNNIMDTPGNKGVFVTSTKYGQFINNELIANGGSTFGNLDVINNVINNTGTAGISLQPATTQNNILCGPGFPVLDPALNNKINQDYSTVYAGTGTTDEKFKLASGSPATGAGASGTDAGPYGGSSPYRLSGVGDGIPTITNFTVPGTVPQNGTLNVKVSAKVH